MDESTTLRVINHFQEILNDLPTLITRASCDTNSVKDVIKNVTVDLRDQINKIVSIPKETHKQQQREIKRLRAGIKFIKSLYQQNVGGYNASIRLVRDKCDKRKVELERVRRQLLQTKLNLEMLQNQQYMKTDDADQKNQLLNQLAQITADYRVLQADYARLERAKESLETSSKNTAAATDAIVKSEGDSLYDLLRILYPNEPRNSLENMKTFLRSYLQSTMDLKQAYMELQDQLAIMKASNAQKDADLDKLQRELLRINTDYGSALTENSSLNRQITSQDALYLELQKARNEILSLSTNHANKLAEGQRQLNEADSRNKQLEQTIKMYSDEKQTITIERDGLLQDLDSVAKKYNIQINILNTKLEAAITDVDNLEKENRDLRERIRKYLQEGGDLTFDRDQLLTELDETREQLYKLKESHRIQVQELQDQLNKVLASNESLLAENADLKRELQQNDQELSTIVERNKKQLAIMSTNNKADISRLQQQIEDYMQETEQLKRDNTDLKKRITAFLQEGSDLETSRDQLARELEEIRSRYESLVNQNKSDISRISEQLSRESANLAKVSAENAKLRNEAERLRTTGEKRVEGELDSVTAKLTRITQEKDIITKQLEELRATGPPQLIEELESFKNQLQNMEDEKQETLQQMRQLQADINSKDEEKRRLASENLRLRTEANEAKTLIADHRLLKNYADKLKQLIDYRNELNIPDNTFVMELLKLTSNENYTINTEALIPTVVASSEPVYAKALPRAQRESVRKAVTADTKQSVKNTPTEEDTRESRVKDAETLRREKRRQTLDNKRGIQSSSDNEEIRNDPNETEEDSSIYSTVTNLFGWK